MLKIVAATSFFGFLYCSWRLNQLEFRVYVVNPGNWGFERLDLGDLEEEVPFWFLVDVVIGLIVLFRE